MSTRIGTGFDVHPLVEGRPCILGGIEIDHPTGPVGHSDGDAVLHAVIDAILGAAGMNDIGAMFPSDDDRWKGAESSTLLQHALEPVLQAGWRILNVDVTVITEGPRIAPYRQAMRESIARLLHVDVPRVNVKATTVDGLGALAGGAGVAVQAVCLLEGED
ncbi:MAG: 2-C-methyl-D-erythritol 2,4-cyclodiphosphate synthase [Planctomycetota bacterium]|nr:2-C-methyl-D-erythritol 2,4-cyclodiphosphate synthase [Planctomycetota bacterium]